LRRHQAEQLVICLRAMLVRPFRSSIGRHLHKLTGSLTARNQPRRLDLDLASPVLWSAASIAYDDYELAWSRNLAAPEG